MINLVLLFPLLACLIIYFFKKEYLNTWMLNIYAIIHFITALSASFGKDFIPFWQPCSFFAVNSRNIIFLLIMSIIFLAVAIYNNGYLKDESEKSAYFERI